MTETIETTAFERPYLARRPDICDRGSQNGEMADLEEAIRTHEQAVKMTPPDHPDLARRLNNLGQDGRLAWPGWIAPNAKLLARGRPERLFSESDRSILFQGAQVDALVQLAIAAS